MIGKLLRGMRLPEGNYRIIELLITELLMRKICRVERDICCQPKCYSFTVIKPARIFLSIIGQ